MQWSTINFLIALSLLKTYNMLKIVVPSNFSTIINGLALYFKFPTTKPLRYPVFLSFLLTVNLDLTKTSTTTFAIVNFNRSLHSWRHFWPNHCKICKREISEGTAEIIDISQYSKPKIPLSWPVIFAKGLGVVGIYIYFLNLFLPGYMGWEFPHFPRPSSNGVGIHLHSNVVKLQSPGKEEALETDDRLSGQCCRYLYSTA